jgi:AbrB family looped-hinge helix DNA binding protein
MGITAKLSSKFQISIPKDVREQQGWRAGQKFVFIPKGKGCLIVPSPQPSDLVGLAKGVASRDYRDRDDRY